MSELRFLGAVEGVTGSCYLLRTGNINILLDCGLFQGRREEEAANLKPFSFDVAEIDAVVLSHAHLDHSGRLPLLVAQGLSCPIYMTWPTSDLIEVLLKDAASLQERDAEWENKRRRRSGKNEVEPLYTLENVEATLLFCTGLSYKQRHSIADGIDICYRDAGHILGSAIVEVFITKEGDEKKLVFTGDLGNSQAALLKDPESIESADVLLLESTYGDRDHRSMEETLQEFEDVLEEASSNGGNILIPSFAVGRTQEIIFRLGELYQKGKLRHQAVYLDSPMAIAVTEIYHRYQDTYNEEDLAALNDQQHHRKSLHHFLTGGRIRHHLKHNIWRKQSHVIFVGFQASGTPGRALVDGARNYRIGGDEIAVKARIHTLGGFSAHASQSQLIDWVEGFTGNKPETFLVHGEDDTKKALQSALENRGWQSKIPTLNQTIKF
jgi:metallo-beta-lactamase family protein